MNLTWVTSTGLSHWQRFMAARSNPKAPSASCFRRQIYKRVRRNFQFPLEMLAKGKINSPEFSANKCEPLPDALLSTRAALSVEFTCHEFLRKRGLLHKLTSRYSALPVKKDS